MTDNKLRPAYYRNAGKDLFDFFSDGLLTVEEYRGFLKGNIFKYTKRYANKHGDEDLQKAETYIEELRRFERKIK